MKRWLVGVADGVVVFLASCFIAAGAVRAYTYLPAMVGMSANARHTFYLDDDLVWNVTFQASGSGATNDKLLRQLDRIFQQWSEFPRAQVSVRINPTAISIPAPACTLTGVEIPVGSGYWTGLCGVVGPPGSPRNEIVHGTMPYWLPSGTIGLTSSYGPGNWDIFIPDGVTFALLEDTVTTFGSTSGFANWNRNIGHELGHALGMAHPSSGCVSGGEGQLMCQTFPWMSWDHPGSDDGRGVADRDAPSLATINMARTSLSTTGQMSWSTQVLAGLPNGPSGQPLTFRARPRIACGGNTNIPDCVVVSNTDDCGGGSVGGGCLALMSVFQNGGAWQVNTSTVWTTTSAWGGEPDVAFGGNGNAVAVWRNPFVQTVWFGQWNLNNNAAIGPSARFLSNFGSPLVTRGTPRVAWHEGVDRYVAILTDAQRRLWVSVSTSALGTAFQNSQLLQFSDNFYRHPAGLVDLACPSHLASPGALTQYYTCTLVMNEQTSNLNVAAPGVGYFPPAAPDQDASLASQMTVCRFLVTWNSSTMQYQAGSAVCNRAGWADAMQTGVWEARFGTSLENPAWVTSVSRAFPVTNANTAVLLASSSDFWNVPALSIFDIPLGGAWASDWGGYSCDFVEFNNSMVCPQLSFAGDPW